MPRKSATSDSATASESKTKTVKKVTVSEAPSERESEESQKQTKSSAKKSKKTEIESETVAETTSATESKSSKPRVVPTSESVQKEFDDLTSMIGSEIEKLRDSPAKAKGIKFLRTLNKNLKVLQKHTLRISKKKRNVPTNSSKSGFLKPVQISSELAKFTGWNKDELKSRVETTKFLYNYIRENDLCEPSDKRLIHVNKDEKLKKLLNYTGKKPIRYCDVQSHLKSHFVSAKKKDESQGSKEPAKDTSKVHPKKAKAAK